MTMNLNWEFHKFKTENAINSKLTEYKLGFLRRKMIQLMHRDEIDLENRDTNLKVIMQNVFDILSELESVA